MVDFQTAFYSTMGFSLFFGVLGYYIGERGYSGVENDLNNVKLDIAHIKGKIDGTTTGTTVVTTPVGGTGSVTTTA